MELRHAYGIKVIMINLFDDNLLSRPRYKSLEGLFWEGLLGSSFSSNGTFSCLPPAENRTPIQALCLKQSINCHLNFQECTNRLIINNGRMTFLPVLLDAEFFRICFYILKNELILMAFKPSVFPIEQDGFTLHIKVLV